MSDAVITVSKSSADDLIELFDLDPRKVTVIPHGVDERLLELAQAQTSLEDIEGLELPRGQYFFYAGNLEPRKNLVRAIQAAEMLWTRKGIPTYFSGAAAWDAHESLRSLRSTPGVVHVGRLEDREMFLLMKHATGFIFPSLYEGFGLPVLEAMTLGTPVICSDRGSLPEIARDAALFVDPMKPENIAAAMAEVARDEGLSLQLRMAGMNRSKDFSWARSISSHVEVFEGLIK